MARPQSARPRKTTTINVEGTTLEIVFTDWTRGERLDVQALEADEDKTDGFLRAVCRSIKIDGKLIDPAEDLLDSEFLPIIQEWRRLFRSPKPTKKPGSGLGENSEAEQTPSNEPKP